MFDTRQLEGITIGEWRHLSRRRLDETQAFMAERMGLSRVGYIRWESETEDFKPEKVDEITVNEVIYLYRRRLKMTQREVAHYLSRCEYWVREMESGRQDCSELMDFWETTLPWD